MTEGELDAIQKQSGEKILTRKASKDRRTLGERRRDEEKLAGACEEAKEEILKGGDTSGKGQEAAAAEQARRQGEASAEQPQAETENSLSLKEVFCAPRYAVARTEVVYATEEEIAAAIVILKKRSAHFGEPMEVKAYPFRPDIGWRQAALNFIKQNCEQSSQGKPTII